MSKGTGQAYLFEIGWMDIGLRVKCVNTFMATCSMKGTARRLNFQCHSCFPQRSVASSMKKHEYFKGGVISSLHIWVFPKIGGTPPKSSILIGFSIIYSPSILGGK